MTTKRNKRDGLSLAEHRALGVELHRINGYLVHQSVVVGNAYGVTKSRRVRRALDNALTGFNTLRSELENRMFEDASAWPDDDQRAIAARLDRLEVYYPGGKDDVRTTETTP